MSGDLGYWLGVVITFLTGTFVPAQRVETRQIDPPPVIVTMPTGLHCPEWFYVALDQGWSAGELPQVDRIMWRESHCHENATHLNANGSIDRGLMQMNSIHLGWLGAVGISAADLLVGPVNLRAARLLFERDGWSPWKPLP